MKQLWVTALLLVLPLSGAHSQRRASIAEAFIGLDSARFAFPVDPADKYSWDIPRKNSYDGFPQYLWSVSWLVDRDSLGKVPMYLWLMRRWKPGGPHRGSLAELINGLALEPMIECMTCDGAVYVDPHRDTVNAFASVQQGRVVFTIHGRDAVKHVFPIPPPEITFAVRSNPGGPALFSYEHAQTVRVNCRPLPAKRDACLVRPPTPPPNADSAAAENKPRRIYVIVVRFKDATLVHNTLVSIQTPGPTKEWARMKTGPKMGFVMLQPPLGYLFLEAHCPNSTRSRPQIFGTAFVNVSVGIDSAVHIMSDPDVCTKADKVGR